ncbi:hypothetical protein DMI69_11750 [Escherichia coli]|nr:hypothetical protein [Escherichia coli]
MGWFSPLEWGYLPSPTAFKSVWDLAVPRHRHAAVDRAQRILSVGIIIALFFAIVITVLIKFMPSRYCAHWGHEEHHRLRNGVLLLFAADRVQHHVDWP